MTPFPVSSDGPSGGASVATDAGPAEAFDEILADAAAELTDVTAVPDDGEVPTPATVPEEAPHDEDTAVAAVVAAAVGAPVAMGSTAVPVVQGASAPPTPNPQTETEHSPAAGATVTVAAPAAESTVVGVTEGISQQAADAAPAALGGVASAPVGGATPPPAAVEMPDVADPPADASPSLPASVGSPVIAPPATQPAGEVTPPVVEASASSRFVARVESIVNRLELAGPPKSMVVDLAEVGGARLTVTMRGSEVHLVFTSSVPEHVRGWMPELQRALAGRGFDLHQAYQRDDDAPPRRWNRPDHRQDTRGHQGSWPGDDHRNEGS